MLTGVKELSVSSKDMKYTQNKHFTISNGIIFDYLIIYKSILDHIDHCWAGHNTGFWALS